MKTAEKQYDKSIKAVISFVRGVARRLGDRESLAAAQRVENALNAIARQRGKALSTARAEP